MITITKEFTFDSAHLLPDHEGLCRNIHGHTYRLLVEVYGSVEEEGSAKGMVIDFKHLKNAVNSVIIDRFDHALIIDDSVAASQLGKSLIASGLRVVNMGVPPTAENMSKLFFLELKKYFMDINRRGSKLIAVGSVTLYETLTSFAKYTI